MSLFDRVLNRLTAQSLNRLMAQSQGPHLVTGVVERCGVYLGDGDIAGLSVLLRGDPAPYLVLRGTPPHFGHLGLTQPGDEVEILVKNNRRTVSQSAFWNKTLAERCPQIPGIGDRSSAGAS